MADEGYKIQYSDKDGNSMLNIRGDDAEEFGLTVQALIESESEFVQSLVEKFELAGEKPKKKRPSKKSSKKSRKDDDDDDDDDEDDEEDDDEDEEDEKPRKKRSSRSTKSKSKSKGKSRR